MDPHDAACNLCLFSEDADDGQGLEFWCRKNPPVINLKDGIGYWPVVQQIDWCGSFLKDQFKIALLPNAYRRDDHIGPPKDDNNHV